MDALKNPYVLIGGVVVVALLLVAGRGGGSSGRLGAAIESQRIATQGNVALSGITAERDVGMARAMNERAAIAADYQINFAQAFNTSQALRLSHAEAMRQATVAETLGTLQITAAREIAVSDMATRVQLASIGAASASELARIMAGVRVHEISTAERVRGREVDSATWLAAHRINTSAGLQRDIFAGSISPGVLEHVRALATIESETAKAQASIAGDVQKTVAQISAETQKYVASREARASTVRAVSDEFDLGGILQTGLSLLSSGFF